MSRIIRSNNAIQKKQEQVKIQVRNLFKVDFEGEGNFQEPTLTMEEINAERDQILSIAKMEIEAQKQEFERYRQEQIENIDQLRKMWEEEKLVLEQNAYDQGFQQGYEEGMKKAQVDMQEAYSLANKIIDDSRSMAQSYIEEQERVILELAISASERIIGTSLDRDDEVFLSIIKRGVKEAREMKEVKIYVSPRYHQLVSQHREELVEMFPTDVPLLVFVDEELNETECYIETNHGRIVVSVDEQLSELRIKLNEILDSKE
ncbi:flagellar assembly protein FliH [Ureibacillus chungkukjangi]|uniref:Flagellar assembly protein FliH n=1 Tax=Ureibacillus chungkukjangi TaxID=1202712 RepID=A0A318TYF7_9BACL|nr:flagellar assembly protein FliH [Ureibacillus chungkukjangi]PYF07105.1 flagellar assembly protein FliH [Ureibacillus chungkukjangi]